jgi:hypothetical protein
MQGAFCLPPTSGSPFLRRPEKGLGVRFLLRVVTTLFRDELFSLTPARPACYVYRMDHTHEALNPLKPGFPAKTNFDGTKLPIVVCPPLHHK